MFVYFTKPHFFLVVTCRNNDNLKAIEKMVPTSILENRRDTIECKQLLTILEKGGMSTCLRAVKNGLTFKRKSQDIFELAQLLKCTIKPSPVLPRILLVSAVRIKGTRYFVYPSLNAPLCMFEYHFISETLMAIMKLTKDYTNVGVCVIIAYGISQSHSQSESCINKLGNKILYRKETIKRTKENFSDNFGFIFIIYLLSVQTFCYVYLFVSDSDEQRYKKRMARESDLEDELRNTEKEEGSKDKESDNDDDDDDSEQDVEEDEEVIDGERRRRSCIKK